MAKLRTRAPHLVGEAVAGELEAALELLLLLLLLMLELLSSST